MPDPDLRGCPLPWPFPLGKEPAEPEMSPEAIKLFGDILVENAKALMEGRTEGMMTLTGIRWSHDSEGTPT